METKTYTREALIYDFMMSSTRPAEELHFFVEAWDKNPHTLTMEDFISLTNNQVQQLRDKIREENNQTITTYTTPEGTLPIVDEPAPAPQPKKRVKAKKLYHANSKLTNAQFIDVWMDENDVVSFASQQAAADFLGVSAATVCEALKKKRRVKGYNLKRVDAPFTTNKKG